MLTDDAMYDRMAKGWRAGQPETVCGNGSTMSATRNAREWLPRACQRYQIRTLNDAGAGDMAWIRKVEWDVDYQPFDLIPRLPEVAKLDITREIIPPCDAILCRMVLNHLQERIVETTDLIKRSAAKYLIATQFDDAPSRTIQFQRLDLRLYFGDYIDSVQDGNEGECKLALWEIR